MVKCPICWTPVKKDGLESHQQYSSYCAQWRKFQERGQKAEKGQQGKDDEDVKKKCPHCDRQFNKRWDLLQHCLRFHPKSREARECSEHMRGRKAKPAESSQGARAGSGSANRTRSTDRVRLRSRTRRASRHAAMMTAEMAVMAARAQGAGPGTMRPGRPGAKQSVANPWRPWLESILEARARGGDGSGVVFANDDSDPGLAGSKRLRRLTDRSKP